MVSKAVLPVTFLLGFTLAAGQGNPTSTREIRERQAQEEEVAIQLRMIDDLRGPAPRQRPKPNLGLIREDYVRLQVVNNELAQAVAANKTLDLKFVGKSSDEIRKRAKRLRSNLALPETEHAKPPNKDQIEASQLLAALGELDKLVLGFVRNPIFRNPKLVKLEQLLTSSRELDEILELSHRIKKAIEKAQSGSP